jgi:hypothetical protein
MDEVKKQIESLFPKLNDSDFKITSKPSNKYNCVGFAADDGEESRWWWPKTDQYRGFWPEDVPEEESLEAFIQAFQTLGYEVCDSEELETEYEKIAIYTDESGCPTHVAKQKGTKWKSKLGQSHDITHETLEGLKGYRYGSVAEIMKRRRRPNQ